MLISLLTLLLISNALTLRTDKSILFSRVVMVSLIHTSFLAYNNLFFLSLDKGIGIFGGLFQVNLFTQIFKLLNFFFCGLIKNIQLVLLLLKKIPPPLIYICYLQIVFNCLYNYIRRSSFYIHLLLNFN